MDRRQTLTIGAKSARGGLALGVVLACLIASTGCRTMSPEKDAGPLAPIIDSSERQALLPWKDDEPKIGKASQIVATWTDTVLQEGGKGATRGFGGRLYFYGSGDQKPIAVEGQLVVYAFDEANRAATDNKPTKRYVFPPEQFDLHRSVSDLGVSYSFWLPWGKVEGAQTDVSLIARFEPVKGGALVVSDQSTVRLPGQLDGPQVVSEKLIAKRITPVKTISHQEPIDQPSAEQEASPPLNSQTQTTTIKLPKNSRVTRKRLAPSPTSSPNVSAAPVLEGPRTTVKYLTPGESAQRRLGR